MHGPSHLKWGALIRGLRETIIYMVMRIAAEYPFRPPMARWIRIAVVVFAAAILIGLVLDIRAEPDLFNLFMGGFVSAAWLAFGVYGGFPLFETVQDWHAPATPCEITDAHRQGLLVMRRRKWIMWAAYPVALAMVPFLHGALEGLGQAPLVVVLLFVPLAVLSFRYWLSRCPRCGYGFFVRSKNRAGLTILTNSCPHCELPLRAHKSH